MPVLAPTSRKINQRHGKFNQSHGKLTTFLWGGFCADDQDDGAARKRRVVAAPGGFVRQDECCFCATQIVALPMNGWARHCWISPNLALHRASNTFTIPEHLALCRSINTLAQKELHSTGNVFFFGKQWKSCVRNHADPSPMQTQIQNVWSQISKSVCWCMYNSK